MGELKTLNKLYIDIIGMVQPGPTNKTFQLVERNEQLKKKKTRFPKNRKFILKTLDSKTRCMRNLIAQRKTEGHLVNYHGKGRDLFNPFTLE